MTNAMNLGQLRELLKEWVVPSGFLRLIRGRLVEQASRPSANESAILSRNAKFRNAYAGRRCFIIGNGPSLSKQDLTPLAGEVTIVMNHFNMHPIIEIWKPTFFCLAEPEGQFDHDLIRIFLDKTEAQANFFRIGLKETIEENKYIPPEMVYYLKMKGALYDWPIQRHGLDLTKPIPGAFTTAHMAIMLALYIGCSPIYLIGLDHDWLTRIEVAQHFYGTSPRASGFYVHSYKTRLEKIIKTWKIYESLQYIADKQGVTIYNATAGGFLDVFPRVVFEDLFPPVDKG